MNAVLYPPLPVLGRAATPPLTNLALWLSAGPGYCFTDAAGTVPCADTDPVRVWKDRSGNVRDFSQATSGLRPTLRLVSGKWAVRFDGVDDYLRASTFSAGSNCSLYFRVTPTTSTPGGMFDSAPATASTIRNNPSGDWDWHASQPRFSIGGLTGGAAATLGFLHSLAPSRRVDYRRNGSAVSTNTDPSTSAAAWVTPTIGTVNTTFSPLAGDLAGVLVYSATHDAAAAALVEAYLGGL